MARLRTTLARLSAHSFPRFLVVGGLSFLVDLGLLALGYEVLGLPLWVAAQGGFWGSLAVNFTLQRALAFPGGRPAAASLWRYGALLVANSLVTVLLVQVGEWSGIGYAAGKVAATVMTTLWNYALYRWWVFAPGRVPAAG
jgi:putative flippase GtrA